MTSTQCSTTPIVALTHKTHNQQCLQPPTRLKHCDSDFEFSIHAPPPRFQRELTHIFPAMRRQELKRILVVPVIQRCDNDMVGVTLAANAERDVRLELVCSFFFFCYFCYTFITLALIIHPVMLSSLSGESS